VVFGKEEDSCFKLSSKFWIVSVILHATFSLAIFDMSIVLSTDLLEV
jgi:hypothetical protein